MAREHAYPANLIDEALTKEHKEALARAGWIDMTAVHEILPLNYSLNSAFTPAYVQALEHMGLRSMAFNKSKDDGDRQVRFFYRNSVKAVARLYKERSKPKAATQQKFHFGQPADVVTREELPGLIAAGVKAAMEQMFAPATPAPATTPVPATAETPAPVGA